jgi:hypothetical protein
MARTCDCGLLLARGTGAATIVDFAMFTFAQSSGIDDTMIRLAPALTRLRGVLDRGQGTQDWAATVPLAHAGVDLYRNTAGTGARRCITS